MNSRRESYTRDPRLRLQDVKFTTLASKDLKRRRTRYSEVNKLTFHQFVFADHGRVDLKSTV